MKPDPERPDNVERRVRTPSWTTLALVGGLVLLVLLVAYFATSRNADQDKLTSSQISQGDANASDPEKLCANKSTYDRIKHELFRRAAQLRGSDQAAFDRLSAYAVLRMENPVMESQDNATGAVNCSGSLALDLPPGVAVVGGRRSLTSDVDYTVQAAADDSGNVVLLRNADSIIAPLATLARTGQPVTEPAPPAETSKGPADQPEINVDASESANQEVGPRTSYPARPSFDCSRATSKSEIAVCSDGGLAALDVNMANQYRRALTNASPEEQALLRQTRNRFLGYRDRCPNRACIGEAYVQRMREIRDIMEGTWTPAIR
jgi:uncharacterized protein YecT (DUF1311 family)